MFFSLGEVTEGLPGANTGDRTPIAGLGAGSPAWGLAPILHACIVRFDVMCVSEKFWELFLELNTACAIPPASAPAMITA